MFTGIITEIGKIEKIENVSGKVFCTIKCQKMQSDLIIGESIACNGICLTVTNFTQNSITMEIMNQTYNITTAKFWKVFTQIHLEKALKLSDRLNGHIVQGHIDTISQLIKKKEENKTLYLDFNLPNEFETLLVPHGSIAIDGVSLTVANLYNGSFQVALIQHTQKVTFFENLNTGDNVNLEFDIIGKYIQRLANFPNKNTITQEWLNENGF